MANYHRKVSKELVQEILLDEPDSIREIVERVLHEVPEAEMTKQYRGGSCLACRECCRIRHLRQGPAGAAGCVAMEQRFGVALG
jgi:hypothetical protein